MLYQHLPLLSSCPSHAAFAYEVRFDASVYLEHTASGIVVVSVALASHGTPSYAYTEPVTRTTVQIAPADWSVPAGPNW
eukprot:2798757-Rhodomonas_salina.1